MALIQNPSPGRKLQQGLRLTELPDSILAPEIVGVILLEDYTAPLSDIARGCYTGVARGAVAAEFSRVLIRRIPSPVGAQPQYDVTITRIMISGDTTQTVSIVAPSTDLPLSSFATSATAFADRSIRGSPTAFVGLDTDAVFTAGVAMYRFRSLANRTYDIPVNIKLGKISDVVGADSLVVTAESLNTEIIVGIEWTESDLPG